jgi:hypothetical protein
MAMMLPGVMEERRLETLVLKHEKISLKFQINVTDLETLSRKGPILGALLDPNRPMPASPQTFARSLTEWTKESPRLIPITHERNR